MKSVLISIRPQWCEKIANGEKTIEVRKTRPKLELPFKCYIYCTKDGRNPLAYSDYCGYDMTDFSKDFLANGQVIGEFVCDRIYQYASDFFRSAPLERTDISTEDMTRLSCLTAKELYEYEHSAEPKENCINLIGLYGWHISELKIYDTPKVLSQFVTEGDCDCDNCHKCYWLDRGNGYNVEDDCNLVYDYKPLFRPPQSWCYAKDGEG